MSNNDERKDDGEDWNEDLPDPTKDAFFSDMLDMEKEIDNEAYELVAHALSLVDSRYYDDAIEILRQAVGLYSQISRDAEINAINQKISEIYVLKEQTFRAVEEVAEPEIETQVTESAEEQDPTPDSEIQYGVEQLLEEASQLVEIEEFGEALERYKEAVRIYQEANNIAGVEHVEAFIRECEMKQFEIEESIGGVISEEIESTKEQEEDKQDKYDTEKDEKIKDNEIAKQKEKEISEDAYELMSKATTLLKTHQHEKSIELYERAKELFKEIGWKNEIEKVQQSIVQIRRERKKHLEKQERLKEKQLKAQELKRKQAIQIEKKAREQKIAETAKQQRLEELKHVKDEEEHLETKITGMIQNARAMMRDYERDIKKGDFDKEPPFLEVIEIYEEIKGIVSEKGWKDQITIYTQEILVIRQKLDKDKKLREVEAQKAIHQKEIEDLHKVKHTEKVITPEQIKLLEEQAQDKVDEIEFQKFLTGINSKTEKMVREYETELRKRLSSGYDKDDKLDIECPYNEIINGLIAISKQLNERGWKDEAKIYTNQIKVYQQKLDKDKKLREIEAKKAVRQSQLEDMHKIQKVEGSESEKVKISEVEYQKAVEEADLSKEISDMIDDAEKTARVYELELRKRLSSGYDKDDKFDIKCPYLDIINTYERVRTMVLKKGEKAQAFAYAGAIRTYKEKLVKDRRLREIEAQKAVRQKEIEDLHKVKRVEKVISPEKIKVMEEQAQVKGDEIEYQKFLTEMNKKTEKMAREYETELRKRLSSGYDKEDKLDIECPYNEIINDLIEIRKQLDERGWKDEAKIYTNQIKVYQQKLDKDKKLREIEAKKLLKQKEYDDLYKAGKFDDKEGIKSREKEEELAKVKELERKQELSLAGVIDDAERMTREYELAIRKGDFKTECPYPAIIKTYQQLKSQMLDQGWKNPAAIYGSQIRLYEQKLVKDKRLRDIEIKKQEKQKMYDEMHKVLPTHSKTSFSVENLQKFQEMADNKELEEEPSDKAFRLIDEAEKEVKNYELKIRKDILQQDSPYDKAISLYKEARKLFIEVGWKEEASRLISTIKFYMDKKVKDEKLRKLERQKREKQEEKTITFMPTSKSSVLDRDVKIQELEEKRKEDEEVVNRIFEDINYAEKLVKNYESQIKGGEILQSDCPYEEIVEIYRQSKTKFEEIGWNEEASKLNNSIRFYKGKQEKDKKLRDVERQKLDKDEQFKKSMKQGVPSFKVDEVKKIVKIDEKKEEEELVSNEALELIDEAEKIAKDYEAELKAGELPESPYENVIKIYRDAKKMFEEIGWLEQANTLLNTINFYKKKLEADKRLRALEEEKLKKKQEELLITQKLIEDSKKTEARKIQKKQEVLQKEKEEKSEFKALEKEALEMIDEAEKIAKAYEAELKAGELFESPYENVIKMYRDAKKKFEIIGWSDQANTLIDTINFYKKKWEADKRLRALEEEKLKKKQEELMITKKIIKESKKKENAKLEERRATLLKSKQEKQSTEDQRNEAFHLMDLAKNEFNQRNYDEAIKLYRESKELFTNINWNEGIRMVSDSITMIKKKKDDFERRTDLEEKKKLERADIEAKLEERLTKARDLKSIEQERKRKEMMEIQDKKAQEQQTSEHAYTRLEEGTKFIAKQKFEEALEKYIEARDLFKEIGWSREVSRINNELLIGLKREKKKAEELEALREKKLQEERELETLIQSEEEKRKQLLKSKKTEERKQLGEIAISDRLSKKISSELDKANATIENFLYNEGIILLKNVIKMMERIGWEQEVAKINKKIEIVIEESDIPIIVMEKLEDDEDMEAFNLAIISLDKAQSSLKNDRFMKYISELSEAKFKLKETKIGSKFLKIIEDKITSAREEIKLRKKKRGAPAKVSTEKTTDIKPSSDLAYEYMDKSNQMERRNNFEKAIEFAEIAKDMFNKLGPDWSREQAMIAQHVLKLKNKQETRRKLFKIAQEQRESDEFEDLKKLTDEQELKKKIEARRAERRKKIQELLKNKQQK